MTQVGGPPDHREYAGQGHSTRTSFGYLLRRVHKLSAARIDKVLGDDGISMTQWIALTLLSNGMAANCRDLCRGLDYNHGAMTRLVDRLEKRGLVNRQRDGTDRRVNNLQLTGAGRTMLEDRIGSVTEAWNDILGDVEPDEVARLAATLAKLLARLEADPERFEGGVE